jgi:cyclopropane fatty-acyl-phospholipid synthase-like methyltransferase
MNAQVAPYGRVASPMRDITTPTVVECYDFFDRVFPDCELNDLTEGIYLDARTSFEEAQRNQANWLLDEVGCHAGSHFLDIGCGYGRLVQMAAERGAAAVGITVSPGQVARCHGRDLDVQLLNYRNLPMSWSGKFDCLTANGSIEHFVQPQDAAEGRADAVYREMFEVCHRLLKPCGRFATTVIHRRDDRLKMSPVELRRDAFSFGWGSAKFHYRLLQQCFGGFYPHEGQLEQAAAGLFEKVNEVDGTHDYHLTSEQGAERVRSLLMSPRSGPRLCRNLATFCLRYPGHGIGMLICMLVSQSWQWQFRGAVPPTKLLRQTWQRK